MQQNNIWKIQVYPLSNFQEEFLALSDTSQKIIIQVLRDLIQMPDPEDHATSIDCPSIQGFNHAVKYIMNNSPVLIVALDRIQLGHYVDNVITLFSCSE